MTIDQANAQTAALIMSGMTLVQALTTTMALKKASEIAATGYALQAGDMAQIAANARRLAERVIAENEAAAGGAYLANLH